MFNDSISEKDFFGRKDALSLLDKRVSALKEGYRQNIAITGQRLAGKTCLLHRFLDNLKDITLLPVYVEVIEEPFEAFAERFMGTLLYTFLKIKGEEVREDLRFLLEKSETYMPRTVAVISEIRQLLSKKDFNRAYAEILNLTSVVKSEAHVRCIVILDEFQNLKNFGLKEPFMHFGKVIMIQKDTMYVISSSDKFALQRILAEKLSLLFGNFETIELKGFDFDSSLEFIDSKLSGLKVDEGLKSFLIAFTDGNPFYLDLLCSKMRGLTLTASLGSINPVLIADAVENLYFNSKGTINQYFTNLIAELKLNSTALDVLAAIAKGSHTIGEIRKGAKARTAEISEALNRLMELNILVNNGTFYFFVEGGFLFWIKEVYTKKRASLISSAIMRAEQFKQDIHIYISRFLFDLKKDGAHRISDLFAKFKGETVEIGGKRHRLPAFRKIDAISINKTCSVLVAHKGDRLWVCFIKEGKAEEEDILIFTERVKHLKLKIINRILIPLDGININATLLAKENKMWIWNFKSLNFVMDIYNQEKLIRYMRDCL